MRGDLHPTILFPLVFLLLLSCSSSENRDDRNTDTTAPNDVKTDTEEDIQQDSEGIDQDINQAEDIDEEAPDPSLQNMRSEALEGMVNFSWDLPEDNTYTEIRITASPADVMWGEAERRIDPEATEYLFDKLVNDIHYTFEIQAFSDDEEVGEAIIRDAIPFSRPLLSVGVHQSLPIIDSVTKKRALGWGALVEQVGSAYSWSPDGTKLVTYLGARQRCALFDRATRKEIQLEPSDEFGSLCMPADYSWSPDSRQLAFTRLPEDNELPATSSLTYSVLDTQTGEIEPDWPDPAEISPIELIFTLDWSPDGKRLAIYPNYSNKPPRLMTINTNTKEFDLDWPEHPNSNPTHSVNYIQWSPDSKRLAIAHPSGFNNRTESGYLILNADTKEVETNWPAFTSPLPSTTVWSPDGELLILTFSTGMQVIDTTTQEVVPGWPTEWPRIKDVAWSHDSEILAISSAESPYLLIIDRDSKTIADGWAPLTEPVGKLSWSPQHDPPTAPTDVEVTRADDSATLSWTAPADAKILDYRVTIEPAAQVDGPADYLVFDPAATEHVIEGLDPEVEYSVSISAISVFGVGEAATSSSF
ncbi:fibronectin type III domain-containing protein [Bradymonas sediminis]|uniref:fibronectin type III domain-containing protein n=1 Tax=Bradymonas sediminis TaxID=1548548 RepID=UPI00105E93A8|nr:fibronectin type III domain-containing protein [Bradymonas sediminis]TDP61581.1 fibronectin type III domain protein [Bradymonas sediminis]